MTRSSFDNPRVTYPARYEWRASGSPGEKSARTPGQMWVYRTRQDETYKKTFARYKSGDRNPGDYAPSERNAIVLMFALAGQYDGNTEFTIWEEQEL